MFLRDVLLGKLGEFQHFRQNFLFVVRVAEVDQRGHHTVHAVQVTALGELEHAADGRRVFNEALLDFRIQGEVAEALAGPPTHVFVLGRINEESTTGLSEFGGGAVRERFHACVAAA